MAHLFCLVAVLRALKQSGKPNEEKSISNHFDNYRDLANYIFSLMILLTLFLSICNGLAAVSVDFVLL